MSTVNAGPRYLLDTLAGQNAAAAYSLRRLRSSYTGAAIRVRRTSDNAQQDIGFDVNGNLDEAALTLFGGSGQLIVITWYDQSENGRHATGNATIYFQGGVVKRSNKPAIYFDAPSLNYLENNTNGFSVNNVSHCAVSSRANDSNSIRSIYSTGTLSITNGFGFFYSAADVGITQDRLYQQIRNNNVSSPSIGNYVNTLNVNNLIFGIGTSSIDYAYYNGGNEQTISHTRANVTSNGGIVIGSRKSELGTYLFFHNGTISEIIFWQANKLSNRTSIETNINNYYKIF